MIAIGLTDLTRALTWGDDAPGLAERLDEARCNFVVSAMAAMLESLSRMVPHCRVKELAGLSPAGVLRLLRAPAVCLAVRTGQPAALAQAIDAEIVLDLGPPESLETWSALGDVWLGLRPARIASPLRTDGDGRRWGPRLSNGLPIDLSLDALLSFPKASLSDPACVDAAVSTSILAKLEAAIDLLRLACPAACPIVECMTTNLVLRSDRTPGTRFRSATSAAALGRVVLVNAQLDCATLADLVEALVHETIHTMTSCVELTDPLVGSQVRESIVSPWTGDELHPHAFVHACLVWFGLLNFWSIARSRGVAETHAASRIADIRSGFSRLDLPACRPALGKIIHPSLFASLQEIQHRGLSS
jgi:HEXXH motif-containing protein